ncbi:C10 family peptidase [Parabacteroides faecis]|nr:C10 family peptidase [Parabacteroides faecis]UVQ45828.1 C10 family peptidase [Parabacteroides faecis]
MKKNYYLLFFLLGIFFSCSNENSDDLSGRKMVRLSKNEVLSISYDDAKELNDNDIFDIVGSFINAENDGITKSVASSYQITKKTFINKEGEFENKEVATKAVSTSDDITSAISEVEFKNGSNTGLALVASDAKLPSVIAFIPNKGSDFAMEHSGANDLLQASKASYLYKAIKTRELVDSLRQPTLEKVSQELGIPINEITYEKIENNIILTDANIATRSKPVQSQPAGVQKLPSSIAPLVKTNWGQGEPYNGSFYMQDKMDNIRTGTNGKVWGPVPVGCVNVALAQIMGCAYLKIQPPAFPVPDGSAATFVPNFGDITKYPSIDQVSGTSFIHIQYLLLDLFIENKTTTKKDWDQAVIESGVSDEDMIRTMNKYFKFSPEAKFDGDLAWASLRNGNPVLMLTNDHAFVLSGILITEFAHLTRQLVQTNDVYWYANLGWANDATGYYQLEKDANTYFEAGGMNEWSQNMKFINNIRAKK